MIKVTGIKGVENRLDILTEYLRRGAVGEVTQDVYDKAKKIVGRDHVVTGRLEHNLTHRVDYAKNEGVVWVSNRGMLVPFRGRMINYAVFVHFGTKEHEIEPKDKKALRFVGRDGVFHFAKIVNHPGYRGDPFLYKGLDYAKRRFEKTIKRISK